MRHAHCSILHMELLMLESSGISAVLYLKLRMLCNYIGEYFIPSLNIPSYHATFS